MIETSLDDDQKTAPSNDPYSDYRSFDGNASISAATTGGTEECRQEQNEEEEDDVNINVVDGNHIGQLSAGPLNSISGREFKEFGTMTEESVFLFEEFNKYRESKAGNGVRDSKRMHSNGTSFSCSLPPPPLPESGHFPPHPPQFKPGATDYENTTVFSVSTEVYHPETSGKDVGMQTSNQNNGDGGKNGKKSGVYRENSDEKVTRVKNDDMGGRTHYKKPNNEEESSDGRNKTPCSPSGTRCLYFCQFCDSARNPNFAKNDDMFTAGELKAICDSCCECSTARLNRDSKQAMSSSGMDCEMDKEENPCEIGTPTSHSYYKLISKTDHHHCHKESLSNHLLSSHCVKTNEKIHTVLPHTPSWFNSLPSKPPTDSKLKMNRPKIIPTFPTASSCFNNSRQADSKLIDKIELTNLSQTKPVVTSIMPEEKSVRLPSATTPLIDHHPLEQLLSRTINNNSSDVESMRSSSLSDEENRLHNKHRLFQTANPESRWCTRRKRKKAHHHTAYGTRPKEDNQTLAVPNTSSQSQAKDSAGWSVTVAGCYHPSMAPDLEMRLSFPKTQPSSSGLEMINQAKSFQHSDFSLAKLPNPANQAAEESLPDLDLGEHSEVTIPEIVVRPALPSISARPPKGQNTRRNLMRTNLGNRKRY